MSVPVSVRCQHFQNQALRVRDRWADVVKLGMCVLWVWGQNIIIIIIIIIIEFIVRLLQCGHGHRCITLSIKLKLMNKKISLQSYSTVSSLCLEDVVCNRWILSCR